MDEPLAADDLRDRLEFEIAPDRWSALASLLLDRGRVVLRGREAVRMKCRHAHARLGKTIFERGAPVRLFHVLAKGEFDAGGCARELQIFGRGAVAQLDHAVLSAD